MYNYNLFVFLCYVFIFSPSVLLPIVADQTVHWLIRNGSENASAEELSTFSFLYCTFPAAPTVFIFASQYKIAMEIVSNIYNMYMCIISTYVCSLITSEGCFISCVWNNFVCSNNVSFSSHGVNQHGRGKSFLKNH